MITQADRAPRKVLLYARTLAFLAVAFLATVGIAWANMGAHGSAAGHTKSYGHHGSYGKHGYGHGHHMGTLHYLKHLLVHKEELGLSDEQVTRIHDLKMSLKKEKIRTKADLKIAKLELLEMIHGDKGDLDQIEAKFKEKMALKTKLFMASIKARRAAHDVLAPDQLEKAKEIHEMESKHHGYKHMMHKKPYGKAEKDGGEKEKKSEDEEKEKVEMAHKAKISIARAIEAATKRVSGTVIEAELEEEEDVLVWEVEVVTADGEVETLLVDPVTGDVVGGAE